MKTKYFRKLSLILLILAGLLTICFAQNPQETKQNPSNERNKNTVKYKVTFIELGSVRCIPCQKMQSVMKLIEKKYRSQVNVVFHDVWTPEGKPFAEQYGIEAIPTQVFLDENGKEYSRHTGFFPKKEFIKILQLKGVK
jgi:thioredoxin 1